MKDILRELSLHPCLLWRNSRYIYKLIVEANMFIKIMESSVCRTMRICRYLFWRRSSKRYFSLPFLLWMNAGYIYKLIAEESLLMEIMGSSHFKTMRICRYLFEGDSPRAIFPFLFYCGGVLGTSSNCLLKKISSLKSCKVKLIIEIMETFILDNEDL